MKAYFVWVGDEWGDYVHGETASKAKAMFWRTWETEAIDWTYLRPIRVPRLDNIPMTVRNIKVEADNAAYEAAGWVPTCKCKICEEHNNVQTDIQQANSN